LTAVPGTVRAERPLGGPFNSEREHSMLGGREALTLLPSSGSRVVGGGRAKVRPEEIVALTLAIVAINGWNRCAVGLRSPVGHCIAPHRLEYAAVDEAPASCGVQRPRCLRRSCRQAAAPLLALHEMEDPVLVDVVPLFGVAGARRRTALQGVEPEDLQWLPCTLDGVARRTSRGGSRHQSGSRCARRIQCCFSSVRITSMRMSSLMLSRTAAMA
jgi:hypothetical protein